MIKLFTTLCRRLAIVLCLLPLSAGAGNTAGESEMAHMELAVSFDTDLSVLRGTARLTLPPNQTVGLYLDDLSLTGALLSRTGQENLALTPGSDRMISVPALPQTQTILLSYEKVVVNGYLNTISEAAIVLTSGWHPLPDQKVTFSLEARIPKGFTAISESDFFPAQSSGEISRFSFSQPTYSLSFAAAPYELRQKEVRDGLSIYTLFFPEDGALAENYLESAARYLKRYEEAIGPFPYNHYAIVANVQPTGFGIPTFTLLGRQVIRLPFITRTSLGHEILHSWFGNSVDVDVQSGNWCEGLTTYLADIAYREEAGEGASARRETIQNYLSYVTEETPPLQDFTSAGHNRIADRPIRAVGYGRSALLFHELHQLIGSERFAASIRNLYQEFRSSSASWEDIRHSFEQVSGRSLVTFFNQRLNTTSLPSLVVRDSAVTQTADKTHLSFTVVQEQAQPLEIPLNFIVKTIAGYTKYTEFLKQAETRITVELDSHPVKLVIDPEYDIMRQLSRKERVPTLGGLFGADHGIVVLADEAQRSRFAPIIELAEKLSWHVELASNISADELADHNIIFLGTSSPLSRSLFGDPGHPDQGFTFDLRFNPLDQNHIIALVSSASHAETATAMGRLTHYSKYSHLYFAGGRVKEKRINQSEYGIVIDLGELPSGIATKATNSFAQLIEQLSTHRLIFIGEQHTSRADHLLQAMLIEALYQRNPNLVIGMEMFPRSSQPALDAYIDDPSMRESDFLKESDYYNVWSYDFRLFRPIFSFARKHKIPIRGLNVDRSIVSSMFKSGSTEGLSREELKEIPEDRDLDMAGYVERLAATHSMHDMSTKSDGSLAGFVQAQAIWDESMAESIYRYLEDHPSASMIVLAGSQHTRKDSGIPPRVARRLDISQASVSNLASSRLSGEILSQTADYLFMLEAEELPLQGKIGVVLQKPENLQKSGLEIIEVNPASNSLTAGILAHDVLIEIEGSSINSMFDVRSAMMDKKVGETLNIVVLRKGDATDSEKVGIEVQLFDPAARKPHP